MIHPIRLYGDPVLRRPAAPVDAFDEALARLADDMIETMHDAHGVGLAGPQIGVSRRLFVALELAPHDEDASEDGSRGQLEAPEADEGPEVVATHVMVNPEIVRRDGVQVAPDGCLSVPGLWVEEMERDAEVVVRYQDPTGRHHQRRAEGHFAHVIQHELDHLDGVLYFDRLPVDARHAFLEAHRTELADMQRRAKALLKELKTAGAASP